MEQSNIPSRPLCVDMDGTLLESDTMESLIAGFLKGGFWRAPLLLVWLLRGRAYFKAQLAAKSSLNVAALQAHEEFVRFLEQQHAAGRNLILVSAADKKVVQLVADRFGFFSAAIGSDGKTNLRGHAKVKHLTELYGPKGFDYAGNSFVDYPVWQGSEESIVVNARPAVEQRAREIARVTKVFPPRSNRPGLLKRIFWR